MERHYQLGLLYLIHLLISADGITEQAELDALHKIRSGEKIPESTFMEYESFTSVKSEKEIYQHGIKHLGLCSDLEKLKAFATLYRLSEIDGRVHVKEIRLLLYSVKRAGIEFNQVVDFAKSNPSLF
ncbi:MAG TPA: hypothetical protein VK666_07160 [Chryseolinea sp.]|nr:hypothetical protein [Chryseolinea sp.]